MLRVRLTRHELVAAAVAGLLCLAACKSAPKEPEADPAPSGKPVRMAYLTYNSQQRFVLVNESHTDRTEFYSNTRPLEDAGTKVSTDEVVEETVKFFDSKGFFAKAADGPAPASGQGTYIQALEVEREGRAVHIALTKSASKDERALFYECAQALLLIYNNTYQLQSVDRAPEWRETHPTIRAGDLGPPPGSTKKSP